MPHEARKINDRISYENLLDNLAVKAGSSSYINANSEMKHDLRLQAAEAFRPRYRENINSDFKDKEQYGTGADFHLQNRKIIYEGAHEGVSLEELNNNTRLHTPDQYDPKEMEMSLIAQELLGSGANLAILIYPREGKDNRDIIIMEIDHATNRGKTSVINTAPDGQFHTYAEMIEIAKGYFPELNNISPDGHSFILSDKTIPQEKIQEILKEQKIKESKLQIQETYMRFDVEKEKVYEKDKTNKEKNIEEIVFSEAERKQKHRLVHLIKTAHDCAMKDEKPAAFYYSPDVLAGAENQDQTVSQVIVDEKGNVTFQTIKLSSEMSDVEKRKILLNLGYAGRSNNKEYTYTDEPRSADDFKNVVQKTINSLVSIQVYPIRDKILFFKESLKLDRIIANVPALYLHDIEFQIKEKQELEKTPDLKKRANVSLSALVVMTKDVKITKSNTQKNKVNEDPGNDMETHSGLLDQQISSQEFYQQIKKQAGFQNRTFPQNDGGPSPRVQFFLDREEEYEIKNKNQKQENWNKDPKNPNPKSPKAPSLEENLIMPDRVIISHKSPSRIQDQTIDMETEDKQTVEKSKMRRAMVRQFAKTSINQNHDLVQKNVRQQRVETEKIITQKAAQNVSRELVPPTIKTSFPIGEKINQEKQNKKSVGELWRIFFGLYFEMQFGQMKKDKIQKKEKLYLFAEEEINQLNNFQQIQFVKYSRIFAILYIAILTVSAKI